MKSKPFDPDSLLKKIQKVLTQPEAKLDEGRVLNPPLL